MKDERLMNLSNLYILAQNFGEKGEGLVNWMKIYTENPNDPNDLRLWNDWKGLLVGNKEGIQSFILGVITALRAMSNENVARLTARSDINLADMRKQKTIIYFITPPQHIEYYSFLTSLFFRSVFNSCMRQMPNRQDLNIYILYDEFGHSTIPNFVSTANTIRGYRVSLSIILQSISQLEARYGKAYAQSIQGGFSTYITYSGSDPETVKLFEKLTGRVRERQKKELDDIVDTYKEYNLMNANEVRTIRKDQALLVSTNNNPVLLDSKGYYELRQYLRYTRKGAEPMPTIPKQAPKYIEL